MPTQAHPDSFQSKSTLTSGNTTYSLFRLKALEKTGVDLARLPFSLRILLENLLRHEDGRTVTADDIKQWLAAEDLVADSVKVIRNHETQESKGFAFVEAPTGDEMQAIIRRFDRAPLEDKILRANPAQPSKGAVKVAGPAAGAVKPEQRTNGTTNTRPVERRGGKKREHEPKSAFATELAKVL